jgi:hypothetical protein
MTGPVAIFALVLLWSVAIYRTRSLIGTFRKPEAWAVWAAVVALAAAATVFHPTVYRIFDREVGVANLAELVGHGLILTSAWQATTILTFLIYPRDAAFRKVVTRGLLVVATVAVMGTFFGLAPVDREVPQQFTTTYADAPYIIPYWVTFLITVNVILIDMVRLVLRYAKRSNREHLRFGLQLVAVGGVFGVGYWCHWIAYLLLRQAGVPKQPALHAFGTVCEMAAIIFTVTGSTVPALGPRIGLRTPTAWWNDYRHYRQLYPLWHAVTTVTPEIILNRPPPVVIDLRFWLNRRVIEIEDGLRQFAPRREADGQSDGSDRDGGRHHDQNPVAEAQAIVEALQTSTDRTPRRTRAAIPNSPVDSDYAGRLAWQLQISGAFARLHRDGRQETRPDKGR